VLFYSVTASKRVREQFNINSLALWCQLLSYGYSYKHPVPKLG